MVELCISADLLQPDFNDNGVRRVFESLTALGNVARISPKSMGFDVGNAG